MGMNDAELIARVLDGHPEVFAVLVDRYYEDCTRLSHRMLGNRQDAEDALQETFLRAYRGLGRYREQDAFRAWLYRILINQCRTLAKRRQRRDHHFVHDPEAMESAAADAPEPRGEIRDALQVSLDTLEPLLREAFLLKYGEGLDYQQMASITGSGVSALKMRVKRACERLRALLTEVERV